MLSPLQEALLNDLAEQTNALTREELKELNPKYDRRVVNALLENKMIYKDFSSCENAFDPAYRISETGLAELLSLERTRHKEADAKAEKEADRQFQKKLARQSAFWGAIAGAVVNLLFYSASELLQLARNFSQFLAALFR